MRRAAKGARGIAFMPEILQRGWEALITAAATFAGLILPLQLVLALPNSALFLYGNLAITAIFLIDAYLQWRQAPAAALAAPERTWRPLSRWGWLSLDAVAALPLNMLLAGTPYPLLRLLKLARVAQYMRRWRQRQLHHTNVLRLVFFAFWLALAAHWIACGWLALRGLSAEFDLPTNYVRALYWCVTTLATVGYGDITAANNPQMLYAMGVMIIGAGVYGYIVANVASILANLNPARVRYLENMERLTAFMSYRNIPTHLQKRIRDYYGYLWDKRLGYDESTVVSALPLNLRTEVSLFLNRDIIERVPLFRGASEDFIREIALQLRPVVFMPGDYVFRAGEPGMDMYFISRGRLEVIAKDGKSILGSLSDGDFFGEIALLQRQPRSASVRAANFCDLYRLDKDTFDRVLASYPAIVEKIASQARERTEKNAPEH